jgi:hypothetical protein
MSRGLRSWSLIARAKQTSAAQFIQMTLLKSHWMEIERSRGGDI